MSDQKTYRLAYWIASVLIAAVLLSGYHKVLYPEDFALAVYRFHLLPDILVNMASLHFQWLETGCAICLLFIPRYRVAALWITLALLILFTGGIVINLLRGSVFSCGCFSNSPTAKPMDWLSVTRNGALIILVLLALYGWKKSEA
ncbi:MAG: MauE/DoxX family redox-associated membrane protein [Pontiella sp.]